MTIPEVCIKARSPPASLPFKGQVTEQATVKLSVGMLQRGNNLESQREESSSSDVQISAHCSAGSLPDRTDRTLQTLSWFHETISCGQHTMESKSVQTKTMGHALSTFSLKTCGRMYLFVYLKEMTVMCQSESSKEH